MAPHRWHWPPSAGNEACLCYMPVPDSSLTGLAATLRSTGSTSLQVDAEKSWTSLISPSLRERATMSCSMRRCRTTSSTFSSFPLIPKSSSRCIHLRSAKTGQAPYSSEACLKKWASRGVRILLLLDRPGTLQQSTS
ncbi:unnamed protein product [Symbiodinium necroappetens]|uniref:Uncharacterized protein n=1 Tax=Symbiodinium necroappetens TaxID=1628268 RepID=A0A812R5E2_9DINO|nr:unnamed protein product [Symbiodinium necroappetens]